MKKGRLLLGACAMTILTAGSQVDAEAAGKNRGKSWPAAVEGWSEPKPSEHPRLFFRKADIPALRKRAKTPEGKAILKRLRVLLNGSDGESLPKHRRSPDLPSGDKSKPIEQPVGAFALSTPAGFGLLYVLTGEKKYADLGKQAMQLALDGYRDRDGKARYSFREPSGALRAGPSLGWTAVGYDLCHDGWDEAFRKKVAGAIANYSEGKQKSLPDLAKGSRHMPGSNHWGMQVGGAALALLSVWNDPDVDNAKIKKLMGTNSKAIIRNVTEGFGDHGAFAEGDGTGSMASHIVYLAGAQAWKIAGGKDFITPRPNIPWITLKWIFLTVLGGDPENLRASFPERGAYPHNIWDRAGLSGGGYFATGFGATTKTQNAGLLWFYNHVLKKADEAKGTPFDTRSVYPHIAILSFVNWPFGMQEMNPADVIPRAVRSTIPRVRGEKGYALYMFRNRWKDKNDIVISQQVQKMRGWHRVAADDGLKIWSGGKKETWGRIPNKVSDFKVAADGSAIVKGAGSCLAVDFSGASGADGMLVMTGSGGKGKSVSAGGQTYHFKFIAGDGKVPSPRAEGDKVVVGGQTVTCKDGAIVLAKWAGPWKGQKNVP